MNWLTITKLSAGAALALINLLVAFGVHIPAEIISFINVFAGIGIVATSNDHRLSA
jgi:hypothetical protein